MDFARAFSSSIKDTGSVAVILVVYCCAFQVEVGKQNRGVAVDYVRVGTVGSAQESSDCVVATCIVVLDCIRIRIAVYDFHVAGTIGLCNGCTDQTSYVEVRV